MFAGSILLLLTADILQEYANTKTLGLWRGVWLHHSRRRKNLNLPSKVLNTNKRNESVHENDSGVEDASGMESDVEAGIHISYFSNSSAGQVCQKRYLP